MKKKKSKGLVGGVKGELVRAADRVKIIKAKPPCRYTAWWNRDGSVYIWPATGKKYAIIDPEIVYHLARKMLKHSMRAQKVPPGHYPPIPDTWEGWPEWNMHRLVQTEQGKPKSKKSTKTHKPFQVGQRVWANTVADPGFGMIVADLTPSEIRAIFGPFAVARKRREERWVRRDAGGFVLVDEAFLEPA